jgi:cobalt/nickel transport system permease protein
MFEMTYRYIGVLLAEAYAMGVAYSLRSPNRKGIEMRDMGSFAGQLLIRSFDRADRVYSAMKCRGYALQNIEQNLKRPELKDIVFLVGVLALCATFRFVDVNGLLIKSVQGLF